jgi:Fungal specific transcription factor domain
LLLSHVPHTTNGPASLIFGTGSQHPFANYWTTQGGIAEVVGVLPAKEQADTFVAKYFEAVDPVYPMLHKEAFYAEYDHFWSLPPEEKGNADASLLALHFTMYAMGAQFLRMESEAARRQVSEFYVSAAHQSLRLYPFLSRTSLRSIEAMVLMAYFLMNDNKATDAWAFCGILVKQAYAMGLHRDPDIIVPRASALEKNQRRKVWQAVFYQDTFFTVLVKLPPTTTFSDVSIDSLTEDIVPVGNGLDQEDAPSVITNPMSISAIAPRQLTPPIPPPPHTSATTKQDTVFIRSMWRLAELVQRTVCQPRALAQPLTTSPRQKASLLATFRNLYASFPPILTESDAARFANLVATQPRTARQGLFLRSNYWHCVMLIEADSNEAAGVRCDIKGALEAGRIAVGAFFEFWKGLTADASVWWVFQHRAFEEAVSFRRFIVATNV